MSNPSTAEILKSRLRSHNQSILAASGATALLSLIAWTALYGLAYWVVMFVLTVIHAGEAGLPASFDRICLITAGTLLIAGLIDSFLRQNERAVDERPASETILDLILFLPRLTLSVVLNFTAWARIPARSFPDAVTFIERLREFRKLAVTSLPLHLPNDRTRNRILQALALTQITEMRKEKEEWWMRISPLAPKELRSLLPDDTHDEMAGMRRATVLEHKNALPSPKRQLPAKDRDDL